MYLEKSIKKVLIRITGSLFKGLSEQIFRAPVLQLPGKKYVIKINK